MNMYKHLLFILISSLFSLSTFAQTSKKTLNYQAVILDPNAIDIPGASITGQPLNKGKVCLRFSLLNAQGGLDYEETQQVTTDEFGLVSVAIGTGTQAQAGNSTSIYKSFESVLWNANVKSLKVSVSYDGCSSFKQVSTQTLNYTPYALYAESVEYKNVREAPTKLSQFTNDAGYLIPKDLDPLKADIKTNSSQIATANQTITENKQASDAAFLVMNQSITSLDKQVADNTNSITTMGTKLADQQNQITTTNNSMNAQIGGLQGQINSTNNTVSNLTGVAEMQSNKSTAANLGGANPSDQAYPSQKAAKAYVDQVVSQIATSGVPDATTLAAGKLQLAGDLGGTATNPTVPALATKENTANKSTNVQADGTNDTKYPSVKAVKDYVDQATLGTALAADLAAKANLASPTFTGTPVLPSGTTGVTQTSGDNSTKLATTAYVDAQVAAGAADATTTTKGILKLTGDLGGTSAIPLVDKIQGTPVSNLTPTSGQVLTYDGTSWAPAASSNAAGSLSGTVGIANGGTGSTTQNFVDLSTNQNAIGGSKSFANNIVSNGVALGKGSSISSSIIIGPWTNAGEFSIAIGSGTMTGNSGAYNIAIGENGLRNSGSVSKNTALGFNAGSNGTAGDNNTYLGYSTIPLSGASISNSTAIGSGAKIYASNTIRLGANGLDGTTAIDSVITTGTLTAGAVTYPNTHGSANQVLSTTGSGKLTWTTASSVADASTLTGTVAIAKGGTGASNKSAAFNALSPMTSAGDIIYGGLSGSGTRLGKGSDGEFLKLSSGVPVWGSPYSGMGSISFSGSNNRLNVYGNSLEMFGTDGLLLNPGTDGNVFIDTYNAGSRVATRDYADTKASINANLNNQTGTTYTLVASDNGKVITLDNVSAITLTVPSGLTAGFNCMIIQKGTGLVTIYPDTTITVTNRSGGTKTGGQYAIVSLIALSATNFISGGDMQ